MIFFLWILYSNTLILLAISIMAVKSWVDQYFLFFKVTIQNRVLTKFFPCARFDDNYQTIISLGLKMPGQYTELHHAIVTLHKQDWTSPYHYHPPWNVHSNNIIVPTIGYLLMRWKDIELVIKTTTRYHHLIQHTLNHPLLSYIFWWYLKCNYN